MARITIKAQKDVENMDHAELVNHFNPQGLMAHDSIIKYLSKKEGDEDHIQQLIDDLNSLQEPDNTQSKSNRIR